MKPLEMEKIVLKDGWFRIKSADGSHRQYKHPVKKGKVTIPWHVGKDLKIKVVNSIYKQAQLKRK